MARIKMTLTFVREMEVEEFPYERQDGTRMDEAESLKFDEQNILDDPFIVIDSPDVKLTVKVEKL